MSSLPRTFSALADETRFSIVERLMDQGELPAGALAEASDLSAPAISRHLKVLREAGIVVQRIQGKQRIYAVRPEAMQAIADWTISRRDFWEGSLNRLEHALKKLEPR